jgi:kinesin family protein 1
MSASQTEESIDNAANPWTHAQGTTMTSLSVQTPLQHDIERNDRSPSAVLEEAPLLSTSYQQKAADAVIEQEHLTMQLRNMAQEMKRVKAQAAIARAMDSAVILETITWSARELKLVKWVVGKWKTMRRFVMAEEILKRAVDLREANVIA